MSRIIALDVGTKRIGIAISDPTGIIATPVGVVLRKPENSAVTKIKEICNENKVETVVIGLPKNMNNTIGSQAQDCMDFARNFEGEFNVVFEDERLTSRQAERILATMGKKYTKDKGLTDTKSACIILQQYLDTK